MKIVATIEARMGSTRLPGKIMKKILGKPVLMLLIERLKNVKLLNDIVIATTTRKRDSVIKKLSKQMGIKCFRGSEDDVLGRVLKAAKSVNADLIVEITADCPLIDPDITAECIKFFLEGNYDYVSNGGPKKTFPDGLSIQVFSTKVLEEVNFLTNDPLDREHVSLYIYNHPKKYRLGYYKAHGELLWPELSITLDTIQDYQLIKTIFETLYPKNPNFTALDVVRFLRVNPELIVINEDENRRNRYLKGISRKVKSG